jgi:hypothetical protein
MVGDTRLRLESKLGRDPTKKSFDLVGTIKLIPSNGEFPAGSVVHSARLVPVWRGRPRYQSVFFQPRKNGSWVSEGTYFNDWNFLGKSRTEGGVYIIDFSWRNRDSRMGQKAEHLTAYDVWATVVDATGKRHVLYQAAVPTK